MDYPKGLSEVIEKGGTLEKAELTQLEGVFRASRAVSVLVGPALRFFSLCCRILKTDTLPEGLFHAYLWGMLAQTGSKQYREREVLREGLVRRIREEGYVVFETAEVSAAGDLYRLTDAGRVLAGACIPQGASTKRRRSRRGGTPSWFASALVLRKDSSTLSDREIAQRVGIAPSTLCSSKLWREARKSFQPESRRPTKFEKRGGVQRALPNTQANR